jgi:dTDP-4-amino-4,6-dideoxygalactose transaminase
MKIPFNKPPLTGNEKYFVISAMQNDKISGDGQYTKLCHEWFEDTLKCDKALLTTSCTHALEMAAILIDIKPGDEVIMPSYTFVSTANAFVLRGAKIVFVDIRPDTMNIDENLIEKAISKKTTAIVVVHYAGISCEMDVIMKIANKHKLFVIEDAAQAMLSYYKNKPLGTIGHIGAFSFHETKNFTSAGEGGLLIVNDSKLIDRAEIIREKGTNRSLFFRGMVDKYSWVDIGSSYLMNDISAAFLWGQLQKTEEISTNRMSSWNLYYSKLLELQQKGFIILPTIPDNCSNNAHMFYIKVKNLKVRTELLEYFKENEILSVFHYIPLHSSPAGLKYSKMHGKDKYTTSESERLIRLPMYFSLQTQEITKIVSTIKNFFNTPNAN